MGRVSEKQQVGEIRSLLEDFSSRHMDDETADFLLELLARLSRKRKLDINRGRGEIWAAAIVYVIARLNFLFDPDSSDPLSHDLVCDFFGCKKSTVSAKAAMIEKTCKLGFPEEGLCRPEIIEEFTLVETPEGLVLPASWFGGDIVIGTLDDQESEELEKELAAEREERARVAAEKKARKAEEKKKLRRQRQPSLFDLD